MSEPELVLTDAPTSLDETAIEAGLAGYNAEQAGYTNATPLAILLKRDGRTEGGLLGRTSLGLLFIDLVFLPAWARGQGWGSRVIAAAEAEAIKRGCSTAVLYTITFQAPDFYARLGYTELGRIDVAPPGHTRICMTKRLVPLPS